jgi:hypothetical protein
MTWHLLTTILYSTVSIFEIPSNLIAPLHHGHNVIMHGPDDTEMQPSGIPRSRSATSLLSSQTLGQSMRMTTCWYSESDSIRRITWTRGIYKSIFICNCYIKQASERFTSPVQVALGSLKHFDKNLIRAQSHSM